MRKSVLGLLLIITICLVAVSGSSISLNAVVYGEDEGYPCLGNCDSGQDCNGPGNSRYPDTPGNMWSCENLGTQQDPDYQCVEAPVNQGDDTNHCYWACPGFWAACNCNVTACEETCRDNLGTDTHRTWGMMCEGCGQNFTCECWATPEVTTTPVATDTPTPTVTPTEPLTPECNDNYISMSINPNPPTRLGDVVFAAYNVAYPYTLSFSAPILPPQVTNCTDIHSGVTSEADCIAFGPANTYSWSVNYTIYNSNGINPRSCTRSSAFEIKEPPGYLSTSGGDVFLKSRFYMESYLDYADAACGNGVYTKCISEYFFAQGTSSGFANYSHNGFYSSNLLGYNDNNLSYLVFNTLKDSVLQRANILGADEVDILEGNDADNFQFSQIRTKKTVVVRTGDLVINAGSSCNGPIIFIVSGSVTINPDFKINNFNNTNGKESGCMFIIGNNLTINAGSVKGSDNYDVVHGFFILTKDGTHNFIALQDNYELLRIIGSVVQRNVANNTVQRTAQGTVDAFGNVDMPPAVNIIYEGGRYISIFGDLFIDSNSFYNIDELPYTNTL